MCQALEGLMSYLESGAETQLAPYTMSARKDPCAKCYGKIEV